MRLFNIRGKLIYKNVNSKRIKWSKKSRSKAQFKTKQFLKEFWENQIVYEEFPVYGSRMSVDFLNATKRIAVEVQGDQHFKFNKFFHKNSRSKYLEAIKRDVEKQKWIEKNNFQFLEIRTDEIHLLTVKYIKSKFNIDL